MRIGQEKTTGEKSMIFHTLYYFKDNIRLKKTRMKDNYLYNVRNFRTFLTLSIQASMVNLNLMDIFLQRRSMCASGNNNPEIERASTLG